MIFVFFIVFINLPRVKDVYFIVRIRSALVYSVYPFQYAAGSISNGISKTTIKVFTLLDASNRNIKLVQQLEEIKAKNQVLDRVVGENIKLKKALGFYTENPYQLKLLPAKVTARSGSNLFSSVLINRGEKHGVRTDLAVISANGLMSKIVETSLYASRVLLLIDPASSVSARDERTEDFGVIEGRGLSPLSMKYVPASSALELKDKIITSGMSDIFPPGIPVGKVIKTEKKDYDIFQMVKVSPYVNFSKLDQLFVVLPIKGK